MGIARHIRPVCIRRRGAYQAPAAARTGELRIEYFGVFKLPFENVGNGDGLPRAVPALAMTRSIPFCRRGRASRPAVPRPRRRGGHWPPGPPQADNLPQANPAGQRSWKTIRYTLRGSSAAASDCLLRKPDTRLVPTALSYCFPPARAGFPGPPFPAPVVGAAIGRPVRRRRTICRRQIQPGSGTGKG